MLPSSAFKQSYCIFVSSINPTVQAYVRNLGPSRINILRALFQENLFCIVIPVHYAYPIYEKELFDIYKKELTDSGFWGQLGMGYEGKSWEVLP